MSEQELFQAARANYDKLVKICERLELDGYWEQPQKVLKQPIEMTLNIYVQSVLLLYAIYAKCMTPPILLWLRTITGEDAICIADINKNENVLKMAKKVTFSPPILLQLCGVTDHQNGTEEACIFLDSILNLILIIACRADSEIRDFTRFIQEYYQHIQVFLNQDTAEGKMNARYLFRKLSCERIEDSLCLYIEDKRREERRKKMKQELERLDISRTDRSESKRADSREQTPLSDRKEVAQKNKRVPHKEIIIEAAEQEEIEQQEIIIETAGQKEIEQEVDIIQADSEVLQEKTVQKTRETIQKHTDLPDDSMILELVSVLDDIQEESEENHESSNKFSMRKVLADKALQKDIVYQESIQEIEVLNINGLSATPVAKGNLHICQTLQGDRGIVMELACEETEEKQKAGTLSQKLLQDRDKKQKEENQECIRDKEKEQGTQEALKDKNIEQREEIHEPIQEGDKEQRQQTQEPLPDMESIRKGFSSLKEKMEAVKNRELDKLLEELDSLIGLEAVKEEICSLINLIKVRKMREKYGMPMMDMTYHMVFTGSPGTGKTTVARLIAKIYKELGILSKGNLVETDRSGLVAGYIGQTAIKVREVVESALGGVLFIDEAYSLTANRTEDFGGEVIDTLVKLMEDHRDDLVVIVAGYTKEMKVFLKSNSGLVSRFNKFVEFKDYSDEELLDILDSMAEKAGFQLEPAARIQVGGQLGSITEQKRKEFGNARGIRNVFEKIVVNQANRLVEGKDLTREELKLLIEDDVCHVIV